MIKNAIQNNGNAMFSSFAQSNKILLSCPERDQLNNPQYRSDMITEAVIDSNKAVIPRLPQLQYLAKEPP